MFPSPVGEGVGEGLDEGRHPRLVLWHVCACMTLCIFECVYNLWRVSCVGVRVCMHVCVHTYFVCTGICVCVSWKLLSNHNFEVK